MWQHIYVIQPIEADSEEEAAEIFIKGTPSARDRVIEEVISDPERLEEVLNGEHDNDEPILH
jgi:hypothetical protein